MNLTPRTPTGPSSGIPPTPSGPTGPTPNSQIQDEIERALGMGSVGRPEFTIHSDAPEEEQKNWWLYDKPTMIKHLTSLMLDEVKLLLGKPELHNPTIPLASVKRGMLDGRNELRSEILSRARERYGK